MVKQFHHAQFRVPKDKETEAIHFYETVLGLKRVPKPPRLQRNGGAWFVIGDNEVHISLEDIATENIHSKRHLCFVVEDLELAKQRIEGYGFEIIPDKQPIEEWVRFYLRDPGGNRVEIAQLK